MKEWAFAVSRDHGRRFAISVSLTTLLLAPVWRSIVAPKSYFFGEIPPPYPSQVVGLVLTTVCSALVVSALSAVIREGRQWRRIAVASIVAFTLLGTNSLRHAVSPNGGTTSRALFAIFAVACVLGGVLAPTRTRRFLESGLLVLSPFVGVLAIEGLVLSAFKERNPDLPTANFANHEIANSPRVVWIVFDQFDSAVAFSSRPPSLRLPHFDNLASSSVAAFGAREAGETTLQAIPALLAGRRVHASAPRGSNDLRVQFEGDATSLDLSRSDTVVREAISARKRVSIVGWYHPYCRIFAGLSRCESLPIDDRATEIPLSGIPYAVLDAVPFASRLGLPVSPSVLTVEAHEKRVVRFRELLREELADERSDLLFAHLPLPHSPWLPKSEIPGSYLTNLAAADELLGEIIGGLEGLSRPVALVVTADHSLFPGQPLDEAKVGDWVAQAPTLIGTRNRGVPWIVKFSDDRTGYRLEGDQVSVIRTRVLIEDIMDGHVRSHADVLSWIAQEVP